ncbi:MAG: acyl-CoA dehydratase activase [Desulfocurvibacter africanus]
MSTTNTSSACAGNGLVLGLDVGSTSVDVVLLDHAANRIHGRYIRHHGQPDKALAEELREIERRHPIAMAAVTGSGAKRLHRLLGAWPVNEVVAQLEAAKAFYPHVRSIIDIGGYDSKYIQLEQDDTEEVTTLRIKDFSVSSMCASGTGSFLDQQATRLGLPIEREFGEAALRSRHPARIAGRCSVFAKSDMIHLQQKATPVDDIVAGLCHALARSFKSSVIGVKAVQPPVALVGGVAANQGVVKALQAILGLGQGELCIPPDYALAGAAGAAVLLLREGAHAPRYKGVEAFVRACRNENGKAKAFPPLPRPSRETPPMPTPQRIEARNEPIPAYLGLDVGSMSTNIVLMAEDRSLLAKYYLPTASRPIEAVRKGFRDILERYADFMTIMGVGATGSGRQLIGDLTGADVVVNEITAHATAAVFADPDVDTIFEIGGQDSKYVHLTRGLVDDFTMNKACAAGTGSFLEEQAERLGISIERDFAQLALSARNPVDCGEQCAVFIDAEVMRHQQGGSELPDIAAGLAYGIATNYLHKVVENRTVGERILFQGGVAFNAAVQAAFEQLIGKPVRVPPHHEVMGAIGCCLLAMRESVFPGFAGTRFKGFDVLEKGYRQESFTCRHCANQCDINVIRVEGLPPLHYGGRCERHEVRRNKNGARTMRDLFKEREQLMFAAYAPGTGSRSRRGTIGYPRMLTFHEYYPFFQAFFSELGFDILLSPPTNEAIIREGVSRVASATCFPTKVAHGHAAWMKAAILEGKADYMLAPSLRETFPTDKAHPYANHCSYVQFAPDLVNEALGLEKAGIRLLKPVLHFRLGQRQLLREMHRVARQAGVDSRREVERAFKVGINAYQGFRRARTELGREVLASLTDQDKAVVLVGKAHNIHDPGTNMSLPRILRELGVQVIPMDLLDLFHSPDVDEAWRNMTLAMGQRTLVAADAVRRNPNLHALYLANFGCVNDSIYPRFFRREMGDKPFLLLEIDEHSAEAGVITRCEAFLDAVRNQSKPTCAPHRVRKLEYTPEDGRVLYLPHAANGMVVWAAALRACGVRAEVLPPPDERSLYWGRRCLDGKECLPCTLMTGDMLRLIKDGKIDAAKAAFFMPGSCGSCRYDLFNTLQQVVFEDLDLRQVALVDEYKGANQKLHAIMSSRECGLLAWQGFIAADILEKLRLHIRPYEGEAGSTDRIYHASLKHLADVIERRGNVEQAVENTVTLMAGVETDRSTPRPIIGLVGEAYLRNVDYASDQLIQKLEGLGAEVRMPAIMEVLWYTLYKQRYYADQSGGKLSGLLLRLQHGILTRVEKKLRRHTENVLPRPYETRVWDVIRQSGFSLDAGLGFGAAVEIATQGAQGIVHAIPFNCVPGLMIQGLEGRFRASFPHVPFLTVAFHGHADPSVETRLEALVYQCREMARLSDGLSAPLTKRMPSSTPSA